MEANAVARLTFLDREVSFLWEVETTGGKVRLSWGTLKNPPDVHYSVEFPRNDATVYGMKLFILSLEELVEHLEDTLHEENKEES